MRDQRTDNASSLETFKVRSSARRGIPEFWEIPRHTSPFTQQMGQSGYLARECNPNLGTVSGFSRAGDAVILNTCSAG